jgi:hypothetical protein
MTATANPPAAAVPPAPSPETPPGADDFWDAEPGTVIPPPPVFAVVIAEPGLGKTHFGLTFPGPVVVLDTEFRADEVLRKFRGVDRFWKKIEKFDDVRQAIARASKKYAKSPGTILFDSGSDLNLLAEAEVLAEIAANEKKAHKTLHWGPVNARFKNLFGFLRDRRWNAVFTARLKDEWKGDDRTGVRAPGGFVTDKLAYHADFVLRLEARAGKRVGVVLKNGAKKIGTYATELADEELTFAGIVRSMEAEPEKVLVTVTESGPRPAAASAPASTLPAPAPSAQNTPPVAAPPVPPTVAPVSSGVSGGSAPATAGGPAAAPTIPAPTSSPSTGAVGAAPSAPDPSPIPASTDRTATPESSTAPKDSPGADLLGEPFLNSLGFFKTGRIIEEIGLDRASRIAAEWAEAHDRKHAAEMVSHEHALTRSGWYRRAAEVHAPAQAAAPTKEAKAEAAPVQKTVAASAPPPVSAPTPAPTPAPAPAAPAAVVMATAEEVAELVALSASIGASEAHFWKKAIANKWTEKPGEIPEAHAKTARDLLVKAKAARASAGATKAA